MSNRLLSVWAASRRDARQYLQNFLVKATASWNQTPRLPLVAQRVRCCTYMQLNNDEASARLNYQRSCRTTTVYLFRHGNGETVSGASGGSFMPDAPGIRTGSSSPLPASFELGGSTNDSSTWQHSKTNDIGV